MMPVMQKNALETNRTVSTGVTGSSCRLFSRIVSLALVGTLILGTILTGCGSGFDMDATVLYNDGVFSVFNNNDHDWYRVVFYVNYEGDDLSTGYEYRITAEGGEIPFFQNGRFLEAELFQDSEGRQYDPTAEPPVIMKITGEDFEGRTGSYIKEF